MKKQNGFTLVETLLIILILSVLGLGGWYAWNRYSDSQDSQSRRRIGDTVSTIFFHATSDQVTPNDLSSVPEAQMDDKVSQVDTKLEYTRLDDSSYKLCSNFNNEGEDFQAPWSKLSKEEVAEYTDSYDSDTSYWTYNQRGVTDAVKHGKGRNCYFVTLESTSGFQNAGGEVCGVNYDWKYNDRKFVAVSPSGAIKTVNSEFEGDEKDFYLDTNGGVVFDQECNEVTVENINQGDNVSFYYQADRSETYAAFIQVK